MSEKFYYLAQLLSTVTRMDYVTFSVIAQNKVEPTPAPPKRGVMVRNNIYFTTLF